ncbi:MAG: MBL fold metallo-hydrolase [Spirochaetes bacterium]|nr:MBL fold metallo-hydrolase [Spirochaetota bacterium]
MKLYWITHSCVMIHSSLDKVIYFDPYQLPKKNEKSNIILISHDHFDHCSMPDIQKIADEKTTVVIPSTCSIKGKFNVVKLKDKESTLIDGIRIEAVPAYTVNINTHPRMNRWLGYVVTVDGRRIYHAGDTDKIPEMELLEDIDIACVPVGGNYTMGMEEAAESIRLINPKIVVPIHNWEKPLEPFVDMVKKLCPNVKVEILTNHVLEL